MSYQGHDGVTFGAKMYPRGFLFGDYFRLTSGLLPAYFGLTWFSWVCLWQQINEKCGFWGYQFQGLLFGQRQGQLEGKSMVFAREGVQKTRFT